MFGNTLSVLVIAVVLFCPMICGSAPASNHDTDSEPASQSPHPPHDSCTTDQCLCSAPVVPHGPVYSLPTGTPAAPAALLDDVAALVTRVRHIAAAERPPRAADADRSLPLLI